MSRRSRLFLLTLGIVLLGFLRGYLFANINWIYKTITVGRMNQARHEFYFLLEWSPSAILVLKWVLTILFFSLFGFLSYVIINVAFKNKQYNKITLLLYLGLLILAGFLYIIGYLFGISSEIYHIIRTIMGMGQSFMPLMILFILFKFLPQKVH